uniref:Uncharacterized protein n=1 Tax=Angiostrongylus cantonensis TaxID=6313 RepID=A0A0K0CT61_ANGCA
MCSYCSLKKLTRSSSMLSGRMPLTDYMNVSANDVRSVGRAFYLRGEEGNIGVWLVFIVKELP